MRAAAPSGRVPPLPFSSAFYARWSAGPSSGAFLGSAHTTCPSSPPRDAFQAARTDRLVRRGERLGTPTPAPAPTPLLHTCVADPVRGCHLAGRCAGEDDDTRP